MGRGEVGEEGHWFEEMADHMGPAYLRYSFTKGTSQEVDFLLTALDLDHSERGRTRRVLDVGCGPGRHALELARRGIRVHGVDISSTFIEIAERSAAAENLSDVATFERLDARVMDLPPVFDAAICLCQGGFGLMDHLSHDLEILSGLAAALKPGGAFALSAFSAYFVVRYHENASFNADTGVASEVTEIRDSGGRAKSAELRTGCFTPRELRLMCRQVGLSVEAVHSVEPGAYTNSSPNTESPEFLVLGHRW